MRFDLAGYLPEDNLMKVDRATMAHGLEARAPYLDTRLVERALKSSAEGRSGWATSKRVLREAARPLLPGSSFSRRKAAFELPVGAWLEGPWAPMVKETTGAAFLAGQGLFVPEAVDAVMRTGTPRQRWTLLAFQLWHLKFIADPAAADDLLERVGSRQKSGVA